MLGTQYLRLIPRKAADSKPSGVETFERHSIDSCPQAGQASKYSSGSRASLRGATVFDQRHARQA